MRYKTDSEIAEVVRTFEDATISRDAWKHAEHLTVALHYLTLHDIEAATEKSGRAFSICFGHSMLICPKKCRTTRQ